MITLHGHYGHVKFFLFYGIKQNHIIMKETYVKPEVMTIEIMTEQFIFSSSTKEEDSNSPYWEFGYDF